MKLPRSLIVALALVIGSAMSAHPVRSATSGALTDIPGTLWDSGPINDVVGGDIYDRVWRLELASPRVVIARIVGESGAELGLYLFGSEETSVISGTPIASSSRPGGSQTVIAPLSAGTYFLNVNGRNTERPYQFAIAVDLLQDQTGPTIRPYLLSASRFVSGDYVDLAPQAVDLLSGVATLRYRTNQDPWSNWVPDSPVLRVGVPSGEGEHQLQIQAKNGVGLESSIATIKFTVDRTPPTYEVVTAPVNRLSVGRVPSLKLRFSEPMLRRDLARSIELRSQTGVLVPIQRFYDPDAFSILIKPSSPLEVGTTYSLSIAGASDLAGNQLIAADVVVFRVVNQVTLRPAQRSLSLRFGATFRIEGSIVGTQRPSQLTVEFKERSSDVWISYGQLTTEQEVFAFEHVAQASGILRFNFAGDELSAPMVSRAVSIQVSNAVTFNRLSLASVARGDSVLFRGRVTPVGGLPRVVVKKCKPGYVSCEKVSTTMVQPDQNGGLVDFTWSAVPGYWTFQLVAPGAGLIDRGSSLPVRLRVQSTSR